MKPLPYEPAEWLSKKDATAPSPARSAIAWNIARSFAGGSTLMSTVSSRVLTFGGETHASSGPGARGGRPAEQAATKAAARTAKMGARGGGGSFMDDRTPLSVRSCRATCRVGSLQPGTRPPHARPGAPAPAPRSGPSRPSPRSA
ncbi:MAG TPA: hypothetical protein VFS43_40525 [Polyangiaceae bacterium]|nr:hypothetical protein [Polyangiaceae bacterium]